MADTAEQVKDALLDGATDLARRRSHGSASTPGEVLIRHYYQRTAPHELDDKDPIDLYASVVRHFQLAERRSPLETIIRVYNPDSDEDGWSSSHTVIDVVSRDMPFIVDSVLALVEGRGLQVHVLAHPMYRVTRDGDGRLEMVDLPDQSHEPTESMLHIEVDRLSRREELEGLQDDLSSIMADVGAAVDDWQAMRTRLLSLAEEMDALAHEAAAGAPRFESTIGTDPVEIAQLLRWMEAGAFTLIGYREYEFNDDEINPTIVSRPETGLGTLRQSEPSTLELGDLPPETAIRARQPTLLNLTKANTLSTVHRAVPLDYVGIKEIDQDGRVTGERRILGLFTSTVYSGQVQEIPVVRAKVAAVIDRANFQRTSHDHSRLLNLLQLFPRDELFQIEIDELESMAMAMLDLRDRRQVSLLVRRDTFGRFLSCLVFVPRDRHNTDVRLKIQETLMEVYRGRSVRFSTEISDAPLARLHLVIYIDPTPAEDLPDLEAVQARLIQVTRTWDDYLRTALIESHGEDRGLGLLADYQDAFDAGYLSNVLAESAVHDIDRLEALPDTSLDVALHRPLEAGALELRCKLFRSGHPITLSQFIPLLHDLGAVVTDERPYEVRRRDSVPRFIYDIGLMLDIQLDHEGRSRFRDAILAVWRGQVESDGLARLVVSAGLTWRDVVILRGYARYMIQIGIKFSYLYLVDTLNQNHQIARRLVGLFNARFDPDNGGAATEAEERAEIMSAIDGVDSLDADRILRSFVALIAATTRTNHWQIDEAGGYRPASAFKLDPRNIPDLPRPVPRAEIFVYSPRTEGVHLRSGRVARGGLRWSDRMEDFRTEILGLMKAQTVKNSVIVPVGAKGGFVARQLPSSGSREDIMAEVVGCYRTFVNALLDVTDNIDEGATTAPEHTVRHDTDDPYLVVAADKGTATFSDTANEIATSRGFWLDDAFASGGSDGYDHKALGITARGAWVSVERHFREMGIDVDTTEFSAVGVGDMSGDVFGNGMLRSPKTRLIAAFDHRHIFVDPHPDTASAFVERQRLYDLPRSSWDDYNRDLISTGGGVFARTAKSIKPTPEMRTALGIPETIESATPDELIRAVLAAPVDLLWNGGIGTYIRSSSESDLEIGDRSNDNVRIDATSLRCRVVAEGGNLGVSQRGRIEFAMGGGRINTDAIDNSAGVDCSDHEVNLKILLSMAEKNGDLTRKQRNQLLESMADDVCSNVLDNNYSQNESLSAAVAQARGMVQVHSRVMAWLEKEAHLDRKVEALPSQAQMTERRNSGGALTRPELAVLLAYTKNLLTERLAASDLPSDPACSLFLERYFPPAVRESHAELVLRHPLRDELIATLVANHLVNRGGISMTPRLMEETSATEADIARAHIAATRIYDLGTLWREVRALDNMVPAAIQTEIDLAIRRLGERATRWLLRNEPQPIQVNEVVNRYADPVRRLHERTAEMDQPEDNRDEVDRYVAAGVPEEFAARAATLGTAFGFLDLLTVAKRTGIDLDGVAALHTAIEDELDLAWLRECVIALPRDDHWETMARSALRDQYFGEHAQLTAAVLESTSAYADESSETRVARWVEQNAVATARCRRTFADIKSSGEQDLAHASVAVRALSQLTHTV